LEDIKMEELLEILHEMKPQVDFETGDSLIDDKVFDSLGIMALVAKLSDEFDIDITPLMIVPENFQSAKAMWAMIEKLQDEYYVIYISRIFCIFAGNSCFLYGIA
jgi:acyl carrier protein